MKSLPTCHLYPPARSQGGFFDLRVTSSDSSRHPIDESFRFREPWPQCHPGSHRYEGIAITILETKNSEINYTAEVVHIKRQIGFFAPDNEINNESMKSPLIEIK